MTKFINPADIVAEVGLNPASVVADFGCGAGYYSLPAAQIVGADGVVYSVDIMPDRLAVTESSARQMHLKNIIVIRADLEKPIEEIPEGSCDLVMVTNILHQVSSKDALAGNIYKVLKTGGHVLAVEWKTGYTLLGPDQKLRMDSESIVEFFAKKGFRLEREIKAGGQHYALQFIK